MPDQKAWKARPQRDMDEKITDQFSRESGARAVCPTVEAVRADLVRRAQMGLVKYGTTVADNPLTHGQWLRHAYEEALDLAVYLRRIRGLAPAEAMRERVLRAIDVMHAAETNERAAMALADLRRVVANMREATNAEAQD